MMPTEKSSQAMGNSSENQRLDQKKPSPRNSNQEDNSETKPGDNDVQYIPASGAGQVLDITKYATFELVLTHNCGLSFINPLPNGELSIFLLILKQGGGGGYVTTFPSNIIWSSGVAPTLTTTPGYKTVIQFFSIDSAVTVWRLSG